MADSVTTVVVSDAVADDDTMFVVDGVSAVVVDTAGEPDTVNVSAEDDEIVDGTTDSVVVDDTLDTACVCVEDPTDDLVVVLGTTVVISEAMVDEDTKFVVD